MTLIIQGYLAILFLDFSIFYKETKGYELLYIFSCLFKRVKVGFG